MSHTWRKPRALTAFISVLLAAFLAPQGAPAGDGRRPIHQPTDIIEPGYYYLTRNVTANGLPVINVSLDPNDSVVIDLNCHSMEQINDLVPVVNVSSGSSVTIKNGGLMGGSRAVQASSFVDFLALQVLKMERQKEEAIALSQPGRVTLERLDIKDSGKEAVKIENFSTVKTSGSGRDLLIRDVGAAAIDAFGLGAFTWSNINIDGAGGAGMVVNESSNVTVEGLQTRNTAGPSFTAENLIALLMIKSFLRDAGIPATIGVKDSQAVKLKDVSTSGGAGAGVSLTNVQGGKLDGVLVDAPGGSGITTDANTSGIAFSGVTVQNAGGAGIEHNGTDSTLDLMTLFRMPSDCAVRLTSTSSGNHVSRSVARGTVSCSCTGSGTSHLCDEGTGNTSQGDNHVPTQF